MKVSMALLCLIWGFNFVNMKLGNGTFPPVLFAALRFLIGSFVLLSFSFIHRTPLPNKTDLKWYAICGLLQTTYFNIAIQLALNDLSAGLTSVLTYSMPLFLSIMAHWWLPGERLTRRKLVGIVLGLFGLFIATDIHGGGSLIAVLLVLSSAVAWALSSILFKIKLKHCDSTQYTTWQMTIGTLGLVAYTLFFENGNSQWGVMPVIYLLHGGIVGSALAFVIWNRILIRTESSKASIPLLLVPIVGIVFGCLFLQEQFKIVTLAGMCLVLIGIGVVNLDSTRRSHTFEADNQPSS